MLKKLFLVTLFSCMIQVLYGQQTKKSFFMPFKVGLLYNYGDEENFLFDDEDYFYRTNTIKAQVFYDLGSWKALNLELIIQPQVQFLKHQLFNEQFVLPSEENYLEKREIFTKEKSMNLYALEMVVSASIKVLNKVNGKVSLGLGVASIDTSTERLAKGFTFLENLSLGLEYKAHKNTFFYIGSNFGHVSNLNFKSPNDGYNVLGLELGVSFLLK